MMKTILDCSGKILDLSQPAVMGILNITPDSFYAGSRVPQTADMLHKAEKMLEHGAVILDLGAVSTRPGAAKVSEEEEIQRLRPAIAALVKFFPETIISVDTFRSAVAEISLDQGAAIINDIYAGDYDEKMIPFVISRNVPYIMMHMKGIPANMQIDPVYYDVTEEILDFFRRKISLFPQSYKKLVIDPGFGFGKTVEHNFTLLNDLKKFMTFGFPVLAGLSRKSMVQKPLNIHSEDSLNGTTVLNTVALLKGAKILRVHDVKEAVEAVRLISFLDEEL